MLTAPIGRLVHTCATTHATCATQCIERSSPRQIERSKEYCHLLMYRTATCLRWQRRLHQYSSGEPLRGVVTASWLVSAPTRCDRNCDHVLDDVQIEYSAAMAAPNSAPPALGSCTGVTSSAAGPLAGWKAVRAAILATFLMCAPLARVELSPRLAPTTFEASVLHESADLSFGEGDATHCCVRFDVRG